MKPGDRRDVVCEGSLGHLPVWAWGDANGASVHQNQEHKGK